MHMQSETRKIDSVRRRYLVTLFTNMVFFFASLVTAGIVPRALGPKQLGDFSFLNRVSGAFRNAMDMGASSAFFNYNSKHEHTGPIVKVYSVWLIGQLAAILALIVIAVLIGFQNFIWPGQSVRFIIWVAVFDWVFFSANMLRQLSDSKGYTVKAQMLSLVIGLVNIFTLVFFALNNLLSLSWYIAIQTLSSAVVSLGIIFWVIVPHKDIYWAGEIKGRLKEFFDYFYKFCSPIVAVTLVSFIFEYFDRVLLQRFGGSIEQGYFHIASSWSALAMIFTASFLAIYKREVAHSLGANDMVKASAIYTRYLKMLYFLTMVLAMFLVFNAGELIDLIAGPKFRSATIVLIIMAFYPMHQVYGMLGGATFYSTERTAALRNISVVAMLVGIVLSYFFLAPSYLKVPGLGLGSIGLALKTVIWNFLVVQIYLVSNCRFFGLGLKPFFWHQVYSLALLAGVISIVRWPVSFFIKGDGAFETVFRLGTETMLYFGIVGILIYIFPHILGITREDINGLKVRIREALGLRQDNPAV